MLFAVAFLAGLVMAVSAVRPFVEYALGVPSPTDVANTLSRGGAKVYDRNGELLYQFVAPIEGLREPVPLAQISPWLIKATIAVEDPTFFENPGVNVRGLARASYENFAPWGGELFAGSGGSSITQQLAKNTYIPFAERAERSVDRKLREVAVALEMTHRYSKEQILEWYLNSISYGGIYVGVEAAAQGYFGKPASALTLGEATLLAGLPQAPARYDPVRNLDAALMRRRDVLRLMVEHGVLTLDVAARAAIEPVAVRTQRFQLRAPHFVLGPVAEELRRRFGEDALYNDGLIVTTTLDMRLEQLAEQVIEEHVALHEARTNSHNGALMAIDPKNGQVLAYVGSRDYYDDGILGRNDNIVALNSPGSTLKPFTYMTAFMKGWGTGTGIPDVPFTFRDVGSDTDFKPTNAGKHYMGIATAATGLGNSSNVTALHAILYASVDSTVDTLRSVGYTTFRDRSQYGPALTLGGTDVRLEESVFAYSVIANGGAMRGQPSLIARPEGERQIDPVVLLKVVDAEGRERYRSGQPAEKQVLPEGATALVTSILSDGKNTCVTWSCGALLLRNGMPAAVKTGASEPFVDDNKRSADTWAVGFTTALVAGVWSGNADNTPVHDIFSTTIAWNAWNDFMIGAHEILGLEGKPFERPSTVVERVVCWPSGNLAGEGCPSDRRYKSLFLEDVKVPVDTWWQRSPTGEFVLAIPRGFRDGSLALTNPKELALVSGPNVKSPPAGPPDQAAIASPFNGATVSGVIAVVGVARSTEFLGYYLDAVGGGLTIALGMSADVSSGPLGTWDTRTVPNGPYTLRLIVQDGRRGTMIDSGRVTVQN
ncbi:MAG: transglycosylase domain-containing protein [Dehalococcoidia bacterium]